MLKNKFFLFLFLLTFGIFAQDFLVLNKTFSCYNCPDSFLYANTPFFEPRKVVLAPDENLFVLNKNMIFILNQEDGLVSSIGKKGYYEFLSEPVSLNFYENTFYVYDNQEYKLFYFQNPGDPKDLDIRFDFSISDSVVSDNKIFFLSKSANAIFVLDLNSSQIKKFLEKGIGDGKVLDPFSLTIKNNTIFIADTSNSRVQAFDKNLSFLYNLGLGSKGYNFIYPVAIASNNDFLFVADEKTKELYILNQEGDLIDKFNYSYLNFSSISSLSAYSDFIFVVSEKDKKISKFIINKKAAFNNIQQKIDQFSEEFELYKSNLSAAASYLNLPISPSISDLSNSISSCYNYLSVQKYSDAWVCYNSSLEKYYNLKKDYEKILEQKLDEKISSLKSSMKSLKDVDLLFSLKDDLDIAYNLFSLSKYFELSAHLEKMEKKIQASSPPPIQQQIPNEQVSINNSPSSPSKIQELSEIESNNYKTFYTSLIEKKKIAFHTSKDLDYFVDFKVVDNFILFADSFSKSGNYSAALDYLFKADDELNQILFQLDQYNLTINILNEYKKNISNFTNLDELSAAYLKLNKAYILAKSDPSAALNEAQQALELAKKQKQFSFKSTATDSNLAILIFFGLVLIMLIFAAAIYYIISKRIKSKQLGKSYLNKIITFKKDRLVIKKAKQI